MQQSSNTTSHRLQQGIPQTAAGEQQVIALPKLQSNVNPELEGKFVRPDPLPTKQVLAQTIGDITQVVPFTYDDATQADERQQLVVKLPPEAQIVGD